MQDSPEMLDTLLNIATRHGLPDSLQPRFFSELCARHMKSASKIATTLLMHAGRWTIGGIMDFITSAIGQGELKPAMLSPAKEYSESEARRLLAEIEPLQHAQGNAWRSYEEYRDFRNPLGVHLDLLGTIPDASLEQARRALALNDPLLVFYALRALLCKGEKPPEESLQRCATSFETRMSLFRELERSDRLELFPKEYRTFEAFAACEMASWLEYPTELGYEPSSLELIATVTTARADEADEQEGNETRLCLWRCTDDDGKAFAGVSGPHLPTGERDSLRRSETFSSLTDWESRTPEEHLEETTKTLRGWRVAWCEPYGDA